MNSSYTPKSWIFCVSFFLSIAILLTGCSGRSEDPMKDSENSSTAQIISDTEELNLVSPTSEIVELEDGFSTVRYDGDYGFDGFLAQGGASSDGEVIEYLASNLLSDLNLGDLLGGLFGCSTIAVQSPEGNALFGRNFDWENCAAMVVESHPENGYASLSTVNMDFITQNVGGGMVGMALNMDAVKTLAALYAPLDGMNEAGLAVSVNMIQDRSTIEQDTDKPDITTTTAIRLLLDHAGSVDEALELLLNRISIEIYQGDFTIIMGPSGAGKSTLLYALSGMDTLSSGKVLYRDQELGTLSEKRMASLRAREFGFVFQQTYLVSNLTLFENVAVAGYLEKGKTDKEVREQAESLLARMHVESAKDRLPAQASGGESQRAAITRAMVNRPGLLFADEPTGALNRRNSEEVMELLTSLNREGQSILMVTHDVKAAIRGDRILYLEDGKILDEMPLPPFDAQIAKEREETVSTWLRSLSW